MISEPEAAAVHCLTGLCEAKGVGEVYIIVDCGGGTVVRCRLFLVKGESFLTCDPN